MSEDTLNMLMDEIEEDQEYEEWMELVEEEEDKWSYDPDPYTGTDEELDFND